MVGRAPACDGRRALSTDPAAEECMAARSRVRMAASSATVRRDRDDGPGIGEEGRRARTQPSRECIPEDLKYQVGAS